MLGLLCAVGAVTFNRTIYIDISTGQLLAEINAYGLTWSRKEVDSEFVKAIKRSGLDFQREPSWQLVSRFKLGSAISPHFRFHSAPAQLETLMQAIRMRELTPELQEPLLRKALQCLSDGDIVGLSDLALHVMESFPELQ